MFVPHKILNRENKFKQYTHNITITLYKINPSKTQYIP